MSNSDKVCLMVLPQGGMNDAPPQILIERDGLWRFTSSPTSLRNEIKMSEKKRGIERELGDIMSDVEAGVLHSARHNGISSMFTELFATLLPQEVQDELRTKNPQTPIADDSVPTLLIHLHEQSDWVPWEMLHDGDNYLGLKWRIARLPIISTNVNVNIQQPYPVRNIYSLLGRAVLENPQEQLWQGTFEKLAGVNSRPPAGSGPASSGDYPDVDYFVRARDADILHITCHGGIKNDEGEFVWTLDHDTPSPISYHITERVVKNLVLRSPLVFGNACASLSSGNANGNGQKLSPGFGRLFFTKGALNFVGTFAPITKNVAIDFARIFYQNLLGLGGQGSCAIGTALWKTKSNFHARDIPGQANKPDLSYLFYSLYGLPTNTFQVVP